MSGMEVSRNSGQGELREGAANGDSFAAREEHEHGIIKPADLLRIALVITVAAAVWFFPRFSWLGIAGVGTLRSAPPW
jgi:hypothetical protein